MKRLALSLVTALLGLVLPSCLQIETTVHLNKDGSGTIVEEISFGAQMLAMMEQMAALGNPGESPLDDLTSEEKAKERATAMGEGVTFEKAEPLENNGAKGARVTYKFADINKITLSAGDSMQAVMPDAAGAAADAAKDADPVKFTYNDGKLVINVPQPEKEENEEAGPAGDAEEFENTEEGQNPEMEAMVKQMLGDMKIALRVVVEPGISETNATHRDGNTITLMEMNMGELLKNEDALKKLTGIDQSDPKGAMEALKGIPGVKVEANPEVEVTLN